MYANKDDKNIFIMVLVIFVVSIVALIAIGNIVWKIISPGVNLAVTEISNTIRVNRLDYNFKIPEKREPVAVKPVETTTINEDLTVEQKAVLARDLNYSFSIPNARDSKVYGVTNFYEEIYSDSNLGPTRITEESNKNIVLTISKLNIKSPVYITPESLPALKFGFWMHKSSYMYNQGEMVFLCSRRYFDNDDPRSCYYLNLLSINDQLTLEFNGQKSTYSIINTQYINQDYSQIYDSISTDKNSLKIVTTGQIDSGKGRLVITANRI